MEEVESRSMTFGEATMKYGFIVKGEPDESGYPLFVALHGGGQSDTPDVNDSQWVHMSTYYQISVENGIYVNPRGCGIPGTAILIRNPTRFTTGL